MRFRGELLHSFRGQLIVALIVISALPLVAIQTFSFFQIESIMRDNNDALIEESMASTLRSVRLTLDAYAGVLNQLYTDDDVVALMEKLSAGTETALGTSQLIRTLRAACYAKEHIQGITVILQDGSMVFYDKLTGSTIRNAWMEQGDIDPMALNEQISNDNKVHLLPTQFAAQVGNERVYLLHMARRAIHYKRIDKRIGTIVLSIDERLLGEALGTEAVRVNMLLDEAGRVISCPVESFLGHQLKAVPGDCVRMLEHSDTFAGEDLDAHVLADETLGWQLVSVVDQGAALGRIRAQQQLQLALLLATLLVLALVIAMVTGRLTRWVNVISAAMRRAGAGDMDAHIALDVRMPTEIAAIAAQFNLMVGDIDQLIHQVREASERRRDAEIAMLEAQINPHFLYNTLDAINWMAIDEDQMEISGAIATLARILRYSIDHSSRKVPVKEEAEWIRQYLALQQIRLKNNFSYELTVAEDALHKPIHKLLFQPFIENAIRHGFEGAQRMRRLGIDISAPPGALEIVIQDNGRGMSAEQLNAIREATARGEERPGHIGIPNAVSRMRMYYGDRVLVRIDSAPDEGTRIHISIPSGEERA